MIESILAFLPPVWDHLLETTIFVVAMALVAMAFRRQPARLRHLVWLAASVKFLLPFSVLVLMGSSIDWSGRPVIEIPVTSDPGPTPPIPVPVPTMTSAAETDEERERFIEQFWLRREASPGGIWVEQEVPYIITAEEREAFESLGTEEERERFIEQFWLRRDPTPGTGANEFRDEHYRRIAYANENFGFEGTAGWRTDRGALYIIHSEPDSKEGRSDGGAHYLPPSEGGAQVMVYPFEQWRYRYIEGLGQEIVFEFVDAQATGNYRLALTPRTKIVGDPEGEAFTISRALRGGNPDDGPQIFRALRGGGVDAN